MEHRQIALDFLVASDDEFERGDDLQGAEQAMGCGSPLRHVRRKGT